jgi:hypothetical protein
VRTLEMTFTTSGGGTVRITVPNPKVPIDSAQVASVMDLLLVKQAFSTMSGTIAGKKSARLIDQTVSPVSLT